MGRAALIAGVTVSLLVSAGAEAQPLSPALLETKTDGVETELTHLEVHCRDGAYGAACTFLARFSVVARGEATVSAVFGLTTTPAIVRLDGSEHNAEPASFELTVELAPGEPRQIEVESVASEREFQGTPRTAGCWGDAHGGCPGLYGRHFLLGRSLSPGFDRAPWLSVRVASAARGGPPLEIVVTHPRSWRVGGDDAAEGLDIQREADGRTTRIHVSDATEMVHADLERPARRLRQRGGPFVGLGRVARDRPWLRAGYEHPFVAEVFMLSLSGVVETDGRDTLVAAVLGEVAIPSVVIFPSLSFGVGVPVQLLPEPAGGFRVQMSLHPRLIGLEVSVDRYPRLKDTRWAWTFRVSI